MITITRFERKMKTIKGLACLCAVALAGVSYLSSCTSEEVNPNYDAERGVVKTEFTISIPAKPAGTRMTAATVQDAGQTFRGIERIKLYPFREKVSGIDGNTPLPSAITLLGTGSDPATPSGPSGVDNNKIDNSGAFFTTGNNAHLYKDVEIEIGTQAFMIYGVAMTSYVNPATPPTDPTEFATYANNLASNGTLNESLSGNLSAITFSPVPIRPDGTVGDNGTLIATYLTNIANAKYIDDTSVEHPWSTSENVILLALYEKFISMKAGSWTNVKGAVQQLYSSLWSKDFVADLDDHLKDKILEQIKDATYASDNDGGTPTGTLTFKPLGDYPADIHLPDGAAYVNWDASNSNFTTVYTPQYDGGTVLANGTSLSGYYTESGGIYTACDPSAKADGSTTYYWKISDNNGLDISELNKYVYPAPLYYRALSDIRTANVSKADVYSSAATWDGVLNGYGAEVTTGEDRNDIVRSTTRSIALVDQVQYAVGRLDAVIYTNNNITSLLDYAGNSIKIQSDGENPTSYFPITGILIGGQKAVDYKFEQKTGVSEVAYTIYDNAITGIYLKDFTKITANDKTHTLVFETKNAEAANDPNCVTKIAVEFQNNSGEIIVGHNNTLILPGTKFYLLGTFDPFLNETDFYAGTTTPIKKTFVQDYTTTANLVISSLKNAYNTVPDLRAPQLELGLSVDLTWQTGIRQTITID